MAQQLGRISGPLLAENLLRNGVNLAFRNDLDTTQLLLLDVVEGRIAVNNDAPAFDLDTAGTTQTIDLITSDTAVIAEYTLSNSTISKIGNIYLDAAEAVVMANLENGTIRISDNIISTMDSNANIDLTPNGTGSTEVINDLNVFGSIYTPNNITFGGTITLGDSDTDDVTFNSDITSDIIPDITDTYNLGTRDRRWSHLYTKFLNGTEASTDSLLVNGVNIAFTNGGTLYVATNGDDTGKGDQIFSPFATLARALQAAEASGTQPVTIKIAPGEYQESLPLVVPTNVTIIGADIRNVVVMPDTSSQSEDVFYLNDSCTISNLTIKNYYYDSVNNTGYAFRFAPDAVMSERSPYIQNITVLTSETSEGAGDAGRGAWIDGSELNAASPNATMLFHSCTFISPNADVINMTNGVRVEWLNSFTYYANRGLYAFAGVTGRTSEDGSTIKYGAELRSIGSANVYGNYGAVADGADTLMYLIQHNMAYIGAGNKNDNNDADVIQANEVVELNSGQIHFVTTDQAGGFRIGDNFFVDFDTGNTSVNIDTGSIESLDGVIIKTGLDETTISSTKIETGNIRFTQNFLDSIGGELNITSATNTINLQDNTSVSRNLIIRDNFSFGGTLNLAGNQDGRETEADKLTFNVEFEQDFVPNTTLKFDLGESQRYWLRSYLDRLEVGNLTFDGNIITSNISDADLEIRANGTGEIYIPSNNVQIDNNLTVSTASDLQNTTITNSFIQIGNRLQTGNFNIAGEISNGDILIEDNFITTTLSNSDLEFRANGTGNISIPTNDLDVVNDFTVIRDTSFNNLNINGTLFLVGNTSATRRTDKYSRIYRGNAGIPATLPNEFKINSAEDRLAIGHPIGEPIVYQIGDYIALSSDLASNNFAIVQIVSVASTNATNIVFNITLYSGILTLTDNQNFNLYISETAFFGDDFSISGNLTALQNLNVGFDAQFEEILIRNNFITTTTSNADLELRANGTGGILVPTEDVQINNNLSADNIFNNNNVNVTLQTEFGSADVSDFDIVGNYISTNNSDLNLELRANGTGAIQLVSNVTIDTNLNINGTTTLKDSFFSYEYGPELVANGTFNSNLINWDQSGGGTATASNGNLRINATGAARNVSQEITVEVGKTYDFEAQFRSVSNANAFYLRIFESGVGTLIEWNEASGLTPDQLLTFSFVPQSTAIDIIFRAVDTIVEWDNVSMFEDIGFVENITPVQVNITGTVTQTGNTVQAGNILQTGETSITDNLTVSSNATFRNFKIEDNVLRNYREDLRLNPSDPYDPLSLPQIVKAMQLGATVDDYPNQTEKNLINFLANGTTAPYAYSYVDVNQNGTITSSDALAWLQYVANGSTPDPVANQFIYEVVELLLEDEFANPGKYNSDIFLGDYYRADINLLANGTGKVLIPNNDVRINNNLFAGEINAGNININQSLALNELIITDGIIEIDDNFISTTISNANLELLSTKNITVPANNTLLGQDISVLGNTDINDILIVGDVVHTGNRNQIGNLSVVGTVTVTTSNIKSEIQFDDILFNDNYIETTNSNADLELRANGIGNIIIPVNDVLINNNLNLGTLESGTINIDASLSAEIFELSSDVRIFDNVITTTTSNSNLELRSFDSNIKLEDLIINDDTINTTSLPININATNNILINSVGGLRLPVGSTSNRQTDSNNIRFNDTDNVFEAFNNLSTISFNGIYSSNRRTSVLAHPTDNVLNITVNDILVGSVDDSKLLINGLSVDDILINDNFIKTSLSNSDLELRTNGTGVLRLYSTDINNNTIQNNSNAALIIKNTGFGKVKFVDTTAIKIPTGTTSEQPGFTPETGMMRWNTEIDVLETWDGNTFITAAGNAATISEGEMENLILEYTLIFG